MKTTYLRLLTTGLLGLVLMPQAHAGSILMTSAAATAYALLFEGVGGNQLTLGSVTINGAVGVGGTGTVQFTGTGSINGELDFSASNTGQYSNHNSSNVGPTSVDYSDSAVTNAINEVNTLSADVTGGSSIALNGTQTVNESAGQLETIDGVTARVFNVTSYSASATGTLTIAGDGSGNAVIFNFGSSYGTVNLQGRVAFSGTGLTNSNQLLFNFQNSGTVNLTNTNGGWFQGIILAPDDQLTMSNANLSGQMIGGDCPTSTFGPSATITPNGASIPEPSSFGLAGAGLIAMGAVIRRKRRVRAGL